MTCSVLISPSPERTWPRSWPVRSIWRHPAADVFADDDGSAHEPFIDALAQAGITGGCGGDSFCPGQNVTRAQMATFLARALDLI